MTDEYQPASPRVTMKRGANRAVYDPAEILAILQAGHLAHVGVSTERGPMVLPMAYGVRTVQPGESGEAHDEILIHGSVANAMMRAGRDLDVCVTVTIVDGLVVARSPFHNSMNYRSVVVRGTATAITDPGDKVAALKVINDHIAPIWDTARPPSEADLKQTLVLALPLTEASAKVRTGEPIDDEDDMDGPHWAGVVPLTATWGAPVPATDLHDAPDVPVAVTALDGTNAHP
jgi:nitroimidazol reductase NimA-like FMN-containing flavoprotein (pyridoxamine 5'-phosphate oxidase superfamily)